MGAKNSKKVVSVTFPVAGVDRSTSYQTQHPYTTPAANNIWPDCVFEGRERGGTRPGIDTYLTDRVGVNPNYGPIRLLGKVGIVLDPTTGGNLKTQTQQFRVTGPLGPLWYQPVFAASALTASSNGASAVTPGQLGAAIYFDPNIKAQEPKYDYGMTICPLGATNAGTFRLYFDVAAAMLGARFLEITHAGNGTYTGNLDGTTFSGTDNGVTGGLLSLQLNRSGSDYIGTAYWKHKLVATRNLGPVANYGWGIGAQWLVPEAGGCITDIVAAYGVTTRHPLNKEVIVAVANKKLYYETTPRRMTEFVTTYQFTDVWPIQCAEHLQKLYMADYGWRIEGTDGRIQEPTHNTFTNTAATNFQNEGVNSGHVLWIPSGTYKGFYPIASASGTTVNLSSFFPFVAPTTSITNFKFLILKTTQVFNPKVPSLVPLKAEIYGADADPLDVGKPKGVAPIGCQLVCKYLDRLVLAGPPDAPHIYFLSRQGNPLDYDYAKLDAGAAIAASVNETGAIGHPITALIPHSDQCLIFGCYSSLWMMRGDPAAGGVVDRISGQIGVVGPSAWCDLPDDQMVFLSQDGLYVFPAGCHGTPQSLSRERLPLELMLLSDNHHVQLIYDVEFRGIHIYLTREDKGSVYHWWFDWESKSFWPMTLQSTHEPTASMAYTPVGGGKVVLLGGRDGYVRHYSRAYYQDDGVTIPNWVDIGPFRLADDYSEGVLTELHCTLATNSGAVLWSVRAGQSAEDAVRATVDHTEGEFGERLNYVARPRARGHSAVVRLEGKTGRQPWAYERMLFMIRMAGKLRRRF